MRPLEKREDRLGVRGAGRVVDRPLFLAPLPAPLEQFQLERAHVHQEHRRHRPRERQVQQEHLEVQSRAQHGDLLPHRAEPHERVPPLPERLLLQRAP